MEKEETIARYKSDSDRMKELARIIRESRAEYCSLLLRYNKDNVDELFNMHMYYEDVVCPTIEEVCGVSLKQIKSKSRLREFVTARKWLVAVMYENLVGPTAAARFIGNRDHSSVINLHKKHTDHMMYDAAYRKKFLEFKQKLEGEK